MTDADEESILALVITASSGAMQISEQSARLRQAADLFPDFAHYSRLLRRSMKQAFDLGQSEGKRRTGAAKGSWRRIFKHFARRLGIEQDIDIFALDRAGTYDCRMTDKVTPDREWRAFVKQGKKYFIYPQELKGLAEKAKLREERRIEKEKRQGGTIYGDGATVVTSPDWSLARSINNATNRYTVSLNGSAVNDTLAGNAGSGTILGGPGDDGLRGDGSDAAYEGNDYLDGGAGNDNGWRMAWDKGFQEVVK